MRWFHLLPLVLMIPGSALAQEPEDKNEKEGAKGYLGGVLGGLLPVVWNNGGVGAQFGVRGGVLYNNFQFQLEIAPATVIGGIPGTDALALMDAVGSVAYLIPMNDMVSWIVRFGGGGGAVFGFSAFAPCTSFPCTSMRTTSTVGFGEFRADVAGVAIRTSKHLMVECNAPSFRVMVTDQRNASIMLQWVTNVGINYVF